MELQAGRRGLVALAQRPSRQCVGEPGQQRPPQQPGLSHRAELTVPTRCGWSTPRLVPRGGSSQRRRLRCQGPGDPSNSKRPRRTAPRCPISLVHRAGTRLDGSTPTLMTAYGGFQISMTPAYQGDPGQALARKGRRLCARQYSRRRRVRACVARRRAQDQAPGDL